VIDGTKAPRFEADVGVRDGRIVAMGEPARGRAARTRLDARGKIVAPGFIDAHTHDDLALLDAPGMDFKVSQGVDDGGPPATAASAPRRWSRTRPRRRRCRWPCRARRGGTRALRPMCRRCAARLRR
jgi:cytosine/adenosine deaminase-related metal-dependent hydrolase